MASNSGDKLQLIGELKEIVEADEKRRSASATSYAPIQREYTLEEIGQVMGVTRERIRQIEAKALKKLGQGIRSKVLRDFTKP